MIIEVIIASLLGIVFGIFTGLIPGVHVNLIVTLLFGASAYFLNLVNIVALSSFIVSMSLVHTFLNAIPAIYLGAPEDEGDALNVLPGHRMLLQGRGYEALMLTLTGSTLALIIGVLISPLIIMTLPIFYETIEKYIGYILIILVIFLVFREKQKYWSFFVFILAGVYGLTVLNLDIRNPLFPMLSSLFGTAGLLISFKDKIKIPKQEICKLEVDKKEVVKALSVSTIIGSFVSVMPGLGPAQAAILGSQVVKLTDKGFLILVGALETFGMIISFIALYSIEKARNGAVVVISRLMGKIGLTDLITFFCVAVFSGLIAVFLSLFFGRKFSSLITKINYQKLILGIIALIVVMCIWLSGFIGLYVLIIGSFLGMVPVLLGIGRNHLMGCLLIPVILFFTL